MGYVVDRWTVPGPAGRRVKGPRYGRGKRWLARPGGHAPARAFTTKDAAQAHLAQVDVDQRSGAYVTRSDVTFQTYAVQWLRRQGHHKDNTAAQAESRLRLHAYPAIGHLRLEQVTRGHVQDLLVGTDLAPATLEVLYTYVRAVFASAVEDQLIARTPCRRIKLAPVPRRMLQPLTADEVADVAARVPPHLAALVWVGAGSGLRPGELRSLTVDRVTDGVLLVDRQMTDATRAARIVWGPLKGDAPPRSVPLAPSTWARLQAHLEAFPRGPEGLVWRSVRGAPLRRSQLEYAWKVGGGRGKGWHELRHHQASLLIAAGLSPRAVAHRLGHADPSETLRTYSHLWPNDEDRILGVVEAAHRAPG